MSTESRLEKIAALHVQKHGENDRGPYVICDYDKTPWPCLTYRILWDKSTQEIDQ